MPDVQTIFFFIICGFITSFVSTVLGLGGGWLLTPILHFWGLSMPMAAGTSLFTMLGSSFTSSLRHYKNRRVDFRLSALLCAGSLSGIQLSTFIVKNLAVASISDTLRWIFVIFLIAMMASILYRKPKEELPERKGKHSSLFKTSCVVFIGAIAGMLSGLLGVGGGFIVVPLLIYTLGMSKESVVAASTLSILLASISGTLNYSFMGFIRYDVAISLSVGALFGGYIASELFVKFNDIQIKNLFIQSLILMITSMVLKQLHYDEYAKIVVFFTAASLFLRMLFIIRKGALLANTSKTRE